MRYTKTDIDKLGAFVGDLIDIMSPGDDFMLEYGTDTKYEDLLYPFMWIGLLQKIKPRPGKIMFVRTGFRSTVLKRLYTESTFMVVHNATETKIREMYSQYVLDGEGNTFVSYCKKIWPQYIVRGTKKDKEGILYQIIE